jgi:subtilisin family serine protease
VGTLPTTGAFQGGHRRSPAADHHFRPDSRHFTTLGDTRAAAALAANIAGAILAERPRLWPETVRGLIVHSAEWTPPMRAGVDA